MATLRQARPAGFWIRTAAHVVDVVLVAVLASFLGGPAVRQAADGSITYEANGPSLLLTALYFVASWTVLGYTAGMRLFGLRVVVAGGAKPSLATALVRFVTMIPSFVVLAIGVIWVAFDANKQGWHDKAAGTYVLR